MRPAIDVRRATLFLLALAGAGCLCRLAAGSFAAAQEEKKDERPANAPAKLIPSLMGVNSCSNPGCHGGSPPTENWKEEGFEVLCRCDEAVRWKRDDKHGDAFNVLLGERGQRMGKLLGYDVTKSLQCLSCHATVIKDEKSKDGSGFRYEREKEGVSCVACHGAAQAWVGQHGLLGTLKSWRELDRQQKERWFGMTDLWDPVKRTKLCASCHVGSAGDEATPAKIVTHDMYAAGHPPLPGFEAAMFSDEMPRHWQYLREKTEPVRKELGFKAETREPTQLLLVGAAVSLGESLRLIAAQAGSKKNEGDPELAMFDCYSCHHEIRSPSWRLTKPPVDKPGRVPMRTWPLELVRLGVRHLAADEAGAKADSDKLDAHISALQKAFTAKQLGDAPRIVTEATAFAKWADDLAARLQKAPADADSTKKLRNLLPAMFGKGTLDFDSARQVAWGYEVLNRDLDDGAAKPGDDLLALQKYLDLRLPKGRMKEGKSAIEKELGARMKNLYDYEPDQFRALLGKLGGAK